MATKVRRLLLLVLISGICSAMSRPRSIFPGTIYIGNQPWAVVLQSDKLMYADDCGPEKPQTVCDALTDCNNRVIAFAVEENDISEQAVAFAHELMHAAGGCERSIHTTHEFIYQTSEQITPILRDPRNKRYARWYIGE